MCLLFYEIMEKDIQKWVLLLCPIEINIFQDVLSSANHQIALEYVRELLIYYLFLHYLHLIIYHFLFMSLIIFLGADVVYSLSSTSLSLILILVFLLINKSPKSTIPWSFNFYNPAPDPFQTTERRSSQHRQTPPTFLSSRALYETVT